MSRMQHLERGLDGRNEFWRYLVLTIGAFLGGQLVGSIPLVALSLRAIVRKGNGTIDTGMITDPARLGVSTNTMLVLMMLPFVLSLLIMILLLRGLHRRSVAEVINGTKRIRWGRFFYAAGLWAVLQVVILGIGYALDPDNFTFRFDPAGFFPLLLLSLLLIPLQTSFEELYFRGYLAQGIGAGTRSRWAAIAIPGVLFGLVHILNPEIKAYGLLLTLPQYILFGLVFGLIATLDDGIECTMGAHAANNIFAATVVTFKSSALTTDALLEQKTVRPGIELLVFIVMATVFTLLLWRRYRWHFPVLNQRVGAPA